MKFDSALAHAQRGREGGRVTKNTGVSAASVRGHGFGSDLVEGASIIMNGVVGFLLLLSVLCTGYCTRVPLL